VTLTSQQPDILKAEKQSNLEDKKSHTFDQGPLLLYFGLAANLGMLLYDSTIRRKI
jgi:hypothetical protein